jgi:hypothetical protein
MPRSPQKSFQLAQRRETVARLYAEGVPRTRIAENAGVSVSTVAHDLKAIHQQWLESSLRNFDQAKAQELAKIDLLETAAWEAWERSYLAEETTKITTDGEKKRAEKIIKGQAGDPRFLDRVSWCINKRLNILGLEAQMKGSETERDANETSVEQRRSRVLTILDQLRDRAGTDTARPIADTGSPNDPHPPG